MMKILTLTKEQVLNPSSILEIKEIEDHIKYLKGLNNRILLLKGEYGAGKDVWAKIIKSVLPHAEIFNFSEDLRLAFNEAGFIDGVIDAMKRTRDHLPRGTLVQGWDVSGLTMRDALIKVAESNKTKCGLDFYSKKVKNKIENLLNSVGSDKRLVIVTDCRFDVEMDMLKEISSRFKIPINVASIPETLPKIEVFG